MNIEIKYHYARIGLVILVTKFNASWAIHHDAKPLTLLMIFELLHRKYVHFMRNKNKTNVQISKSRKIPLLPKSEFSSLYSSPVPLHAVLCQTWSET